MENKDRNNIDDLFRDKLYDLEADSMPNDWEMIAKQLPKGASISLLRRKIMYAAAAVIALLLMVGGIYMLEKEVTETPIAKQIQQKTEEVIEQAAIADRFVQIDTQVDPSPAVMAKATKREPLTNIEVYTQQHPILEEYIDKETVSTTTENEEQNKDEVVLEQSEKNKALTTNTLTASTKKRESSSTTKRWGLGMSAGAVSMGSNSVVPDYIMTGTGLRSDMLHDMNAATLYNETPKTDIKHNRPISFGVGVSYYLNERFSLMTGINYSYLSSNWITNGQPYSARQKQQLHFIGIPVSLAYRIIEFNRFNVYAAIGVMPEINVAGALKTQFFRPDEEEANRKKEFANGTERIRMKELYLSTNARVGISYPLLRFLSAYGEVGASYYFDNGSDVETIHSEKPFNINLQLGLRLGF